MCPRPLKSHIQKDEETKRLEIIIADVARVFKVDMDLIKGGDTQHLCALVRKIFYYVSKAKGKYSYEAMAKVAGRKNHSHCIYHVRRVKGFLKVKDPDFIVLWEHYLKNSNLYTKKDFNESSTKNPKKTFAAANGSI